MRLRHLLFAIFPFLLGCGSAPNQVRSKSDETNDTVYLSLYFVRNDEVKHTTEGEILIFGKYAIGKYFQVTDYDTTSQPIPERKLILDANKNFTAYYKGSVLANVLIDNIDTSNFDCEELTVGLCRNSSINEFIKKRTNEHNQTRAGSIGGTEIQYSLSNFLALSTNVMQPEKTIPNKQSLNASESKQIDQLLKAKFKLYRDSLSGHMILDRKFTSQIRFKPEKSPVFVTVTTCLDTTKEIFISLLYIFRRNNGKIETMFEKLDDVGTDSWGSGYEFIDAVDIDSDNVPELIFRVDGYEWSGIEIYKYLNGKFIKVLDTGLYGC